jgi:hypothetical protein
MVLVLTGCSVSAPSAVNPQPEAWPSGWPASNFPTPIKGETVIKTFELGGGGMHVDAIVLTSPQTLADTQARYRVEAPRLGLQLQQDFDSVTAEVKGLFSMSSMTIASLWARQDQDKMYAVAFATESERPVVMYVRRETSWSPRPLPADWPADLALPMDAELQALVVDFQTHMKRATLSAKTPKAEAMKLLSTELSRRGFTQVTGKAAWIKDGVTVGVTRWTDYSTTLIVEYSVH